MKVLKALFLILGLTWSALTLASDEIIQQANQLISEGKNDEAFELLEPLEFDLSGDETYDLLFGYAALEAGHISLATLAFERVLAVNPDNNTARFHLARAYFVLNDYDGARREFEMLLSLNPTEGLRETVGQYLDAIIAREPAADTTITGYVSLGIGNDSNVNSGLSDQIILPLFGIGDPYPFDDSGLETSDDYATLSGGFDLVHKLTDTQNLYVGGNYIKRSNDEVKTQDYAVLSLRGGYQHAVGNQSYRIGLDLSSLESDGEHYQDTRGFDLEWRNTLGERTQIGVVVAASENRAVDEGDEISDYDDVNLSFSVLRILGEEGRGILSGAIDLGSEKAINERDDGDAVYASLSITGQYQFSDTWSGFLLAAVEEKEYDEENDYYIDKKRSDSQFSVIGGLTYNFIPSWSVRLNATLLDTDSNLDLYSTDKQDVSIAIRKDFL